MKLLVRSLLATILMFGSIATAVGQSENAPTSRWVGRELIKLQMAKDHGADLHPLTLSVFRLFREAASPERTSNPGAVEEVRQVVNAAYDLGVTPVAITTSWVFPRALNAPSLPVSNAAKKIGTRVATLNCIPPLGSDEYLRLSTLRNEMVRTLAKEFPEIRYWIVGFEPDFNFYDCTRRQLPFSDLITFFVDTLYGANMAIKTVAPQASVMGHFLGNVSTPIVLGGELVQPGQIIESVLLEINRRGGDLTDYFDSWTTSINPALTFDRFPDTAIPILQSSGSRQMFRSTPNTRKMFGSSSGWNVFWLEEFTFTIGDLSSRSEWQYCPSLQDPANINVASGKAEQALTTSEDFSCAETVGTDVVPDQDFDTSPWEGNAWTAVQDWNPEGTAISGEQHPPVCIRTHDVDYSSANGSADDNLTRFCGWPYGDKECDSDPGCGTTQFTGDVVDANPPELATADLADFDFGLDPAPDFTDTDKEYRSQIIEKAVSTYFPYVYTQLKWKSNVVDITDPSDIILLGTSSSWTSDWTLENTYDIETPSLSNSSAAFGLGPGHVGAVDTTRTGTSYWVY